MKRSEYMRELSDKDLSDYLCIEANNEDCDHCVASKMCRARHKGFLDWLNDEVDENGRS